MKHSSCRRRCGEVSETTVLLFMTGNTEFSPFWSPGQGGQLWTPEQRRKNRGLINGPVRQTKELVSTGCDAEKSSYLLTVPVSYRCCCSSVGNINGIPFGPDQSEPSQ